MKKILSLTKPLIGMIHFPALPGTPKNKLTFQEILRQAEEEALLLKQSGFHAIMIENMHDRPYVNKDIQPEITACMSVIAAHLKRVTQLPLGIQMLTAANKPALACALAANADFIRAEGFVYEHTAIAGHIESCAAELLRYRKQIGAEHIAIFTDIKKKHAAHQITSDISLENTAKEAEFFLSDALIITGARTGEPVDIAQLKSVRKVVDLPILVGSGITPENLPEIYPLADAFIVGSFIKQGGVWSNPMDKKAIDTLMQSYQKAARV